jgi:hypothetical protein
MSDLKDNSDDFINKVNQESDQNIYDLINDNALKEEFIKRRANFHKNFTEKYRPETVGEYIGDGEITEEHHKKFNDMFDSINADYRAFLTEIAEVLGPEKFKKIFDLEVNQIPQFAFPKLGTF